MYNYLSEDNPIIYSYDSTFEQYDNVGNINFSFEVDRNKIEDVFKTVVELLNAAKDGRFNLIMRCLIGNWIWIIRII